MHFFFVKDNAKCMRMSVFFLILLKSIFVLLKNKSSQVKLKSFAAWSCLYSTKTNNKILKKDRNQENNEALRNKYYSILKGTSETPV